MELKNTRRGITQIKNAVNKNQCHCRGFLSGMTALYDNGGFIPRSVTPQCRYAGYREHTGFTLIELLVVVLIIGILAAVAVPQYQKAVAKSHVMEAVVTLKALTDAQEVYYLANQEYTSNLDELDVKIQTPSEYYIYTCGLRYCKARPQVNNLPSLEFNMHQLITEDASASPFFLDKHWCIANGENLATKEAICKTFGKFSTEMQEMGAPGNYYDMRK